MWLYQLKVKKCQNQGPFHNGHLSNWFQLFLFPQGTVLHSIVRMSSTLVYMPVCLLYVFQQFLNQWRKYFSFCFTPCLQFMPVSMAKWSKFSCCRINTLKERTLFAIEPIGFSTAKGWAKEIYQKVSRNIFHHWCNLLINQSFRNIFLKKILYPKSRMFFNRW